VLQAVADEVCNGDALQAVLSSKLEELRGARHGAVVIHNLAQHARGLAGRQAAQIHRRLGVPRPPQHAALQ
jgi:hypothetical protein